MTVMEHTPPLARHLGRIRRRALMAGWGVLALLEVPTASAQATATTTRPIRTLLGDVALILRAEGPQSLRIGVAGAARSMSLLVRSSDAIRWADSAAVLLVPQRPPSVRAKRAARDGVQRSRAILEEPGIGAAASFMLTRVDSAGTRRFLLFADDSALSGIRQPLALDEAKLLVRLVRRAATPPRPQRPPARKGAPAGPAAPAPAPGRGYPR